MKNRDKYILKVNEFDLCCNLQAAFGSGLCNCVIEALTGKDYHCSWYVDCDKTAYERCCRCIQKWLNEEE